MYYVNLLCMYLYKRKFHFSSYRYDEKQLNNTK